MSRMAWVILGGAAIIFTSMGVRQTFGLFMPSIADAYDIGRAPFSLAIALQNLMLGLPLGGYLADRFGARRVVMGGAFLFAGGMFLCMQGRDPLTLQFSLGILLGLAQSALSFSVILGAIAQVAPPERRSMAFGIVTATASLGMFAVVPIAQMLLAATGWETSFLIFAASTGALAGIAFLLPARAASMPEGAEPDMPVSQMLQQAGRNYGYRLLNIGFFVCGFHVTFMTTHLPAFLVDKGLDPMVGAMALSFIGLFNIIGSYVFGWLGDRYPRTRMLSLVYGLRVVLIGLFLSFPVTETSALMFSGAMGLVWLATVPLTSGIVVNLFGSRYIGTLFGIVFFSHQIGGFLGVWLGGRLYDMVGSYDLMWTFSMGLGILAVLVHLPIPERPPAAVEA